MIVIINLNHKPLKETIMKKILTLVIALASTCVTFGQMMKDIPVERRFHAMSENGKYLASVDQGYIGIYNSETDEYKAFENPNEGGYDLGLGNSLTNDGFLCGAMYGAPAILNIETGEWTRLPMAAGDGFSNANAMTESHKYIIGYTQTNNKFGHTNIIPILWTQNEDGTYTREELPYPEKDFTGAAPKNILPNCISDDGTVIAAQIVMWSNNECLPLVYRKAEDGTWTYELYDKGLCEEGLEWPEFPTYEPQGPKEYDFMTEDMYAAYQKDSAAYEDSVWLYNIGEIDKFPTYWPDPKNYMGDMLDEYNEAWNTYVEEYGVFDEKLRTYRNFFYNNVKSSFFAQNAVWLSTNGKYYATTCKKDYVVGDAAMITIGDESMELRDYLDGSNGYCVSNDGDFFTGAGVYAAGSDTRTSVAEWLRAKGETAAADWLSERTEGTVICSGDGRVISGWTGAAGAYSSWIIRLDYIPTGITDVNTAENTGNVKVYDLQGCFIKEAPAANATDGLAKGIYIINNKKVIVK